MFAAKNLFLAGSAPKDPYFPYVSLLLPGNGTNGAQNNTFLDSSANNFSVTRNGSATQGTFTPYGANWSNYFNGAGNYLTNTSTALIGATVSTFTAEAWIFMTAIPTSDVNNIGSLVTLDGQAAGTQNYMGFGPISNQKLYLRWFDGASKTCNGNTTLALNTWYHIAIVVNSNNISMYVNGVAETLTGTTILTNRSGTTNNFAISANYYSAFSGYISNLRVTNTAVYTSNFTPSTTPLTAITNTSLLTCQSNRFIDNSSNAFAITVNGSPSVQRFSPFNPSVSYSTSVIGGSGYFGGSGDSLYNTTTTLLPTITATTFTIEGWVYPTSFASLNYIIGDMQTNTGTNNAISVRLETSGAVTLYWFDGAIKTCTGNSTMRLNSWNYFAVVVNANVISIYVNKTTPDSLTGTTTLTNRTQAVGMGVASYYNSNAPAYYFNGYLSDLRVSTVARTISSVPAAPLASDINVRWLLNFTNAGVIDNAMINDLRTVGSAQISTAQSKFGGGSISFNGTNSYLFSAASQVIALGGGDWTVEAWVYPTASAVQGIISFGSGATVQPYFYLNGTTPTILWNSINVATGPAVTLNTWNHVAFTRSGSTIRVFTNGTSGTAVSPYTDVFTSGGTNIGSSSLAAQLLSGYLDDLRVTKGYARYTSNFTPPTQAFPTR